MNAFAFGRSKTLEYKTALASIMTVYNDHKSTVILGKPQLNWCDEAVMHWAPPGCEKIGRCLQPPPSRPYLCPWDY